MSDVTLEQLRVQIDKIDDQLLDLINERGLIVQKISDLKKEKGVDPYDPVRERAILDKIAERNNGPFDTGRVQHIFK